jgi:transposase
MDEPTARRRGEHAGSCWRGVIGVGESSLWTFAFVKGVEPTNNHAERVLRGAVLWRKGSFGSNSEGGCRFVERILTVVQTLRLQGGSVLPYLQEALYAHRKGVPAPKLLQVG